MSFVTTGHETDGPAVTLASRDPLSGSQNDDVHARC